MIKIFIENCFCLTSSRVDKSLERIGRKIGDNTDIDRKDISYSYEESLGKVTHLLVGIKGYENQKIEIAALETPFGERNYFICERCGTRHTKLYLKPNGSIFLCKDCHGIFYETFNPSSKQGRFLIHLKKVLKLVERQANMTSRIWYKEVYTDKYEKFLADCEKVGLVEIVKEARALETDIKAHNLKNRTKPVIS